jgi:hypothetical protein
MDIFMGFLYIYIYKNKKEHNLKIYLKTSSDIPEASVGEQYSHQLFNNIKILLKYFY